MRRRGVGRTAQLCLAITLPLALVAGAASAADPTDQAVAEASLLQAVDVFPTATPDGVSIGSADDLPGYVDHGGLRQVSQTWFATDPIVIVYDFRWQFPDATSAAAFLDAAEPVLSEVATGARGELLFVDPLPDTRYYVAGNLRGSGAVGYDFLMRLGNLVAKVYVSGLPDVVPPAIALAVADAAAGRMRAALESTEGTPAPGSPGPSASPMVMDPGAVAELLAKVPVALRDRCAPKPFAADDLPYDGELARLACSPTPGVTLLYEAFDTADSLDVAFGIDEFNAQVFGSLSPEGTCVAGGYDGSWPVDGAAEGRLLCYELNGVASILWSDPASRILASIAMVSGDHAAAFALWQEAGPS